MGFEDNDVLYREISLHPLRMMEAAFVELESLRGFLFTVTHRTSNLNGRLWKALLAFWRVIRRETLDIFDTSRSGNYKRNDDVVFPQYYTSKESRCDLQEYLILSTVTPVIHDKQPYNVRLENESLRAQKISQRWPSQFLSNLTIFPNRISPGERPAAVRERKYRPSEVGHVEEIKRICR